MALVMKRDRTAVIDALLKSGEPSVRWKVMTRVLGKDPESRKVRDLQEEIRTSPRARALIAGRDKRFVREAHVYATWRGAHWTLAMLAECFEELGGVPKVVLADRMYDRQLPLAVSGVGVAQLFGSQLLAGGYRKKYRRAISRLAALTRLS